MLYRMDLAIGEVIKTLKNEGVYKNTIIVYFSDIGEKNDMAIKYPGNVAAMKKKYENRKSEMATPMGDIKKGDKKK